MYMYMYVSNCGTRCIEGSKVFKYYSCPPQVLGEAGANITTYAKNGAYDEFSKAVESTSQAVCQLTEASAQAAYLVGIADPTSTAAIPGLVYQVQFARANQAIPTACHTLLNPASNQQQVRVGSI